MAKRGDSYYRLTNMGEKAEPWEGGLHIKKLPPHALWQAKRIDEWDATSWFGPYTAGPVEDYPPTADSNPLASDRFKEAVETIVPGGDVQFLPIITKYGSARPHDFGMQFWAMNVLRCLDCFDRERTYHTEDPTKPLESDFRYRIDFFPVLDARRIPSGSHLFRVKYGMQTVIASAELRDAIERRNLTGCSFETIPITNEA